MDHVPFQPSSASAFANDVAAVIRTWETAMQIPSSPTKRTGFYEFDLSVFSTLSNSMGTPVLRLRRMWIKRFD